MPSLSSVSFPRHVSSFWKGRRPSFTTSLRSSHHKPNSHENSVKSRLLESVLIANRGEIACRVIRTAKLMGIRTIAVFSEADEKALHVQQADEAFCIGPPPSSKSYLCQEKILEVAKLSAAQSIHPGYGFLSENAEFAGKCQEAGVVFIGPPPSAITNMGIKSKAKEIMANAGVPVVPGYHGSNQEDSFLLQEAEQIGFPIMIKAVRGGGGKGMRICTRKENFLEQLTSARRESLKSFGDDSVLIERFVSNPRHVEVQVFGDTHGNYVHLFERDCSVQRRHQKILEEAPGPHISPDIRAQLGKSATRAAQAVDYVGAGTVEFIFDRSDSKFYFMEMNTRLQVEHPVSEYITGTDLVEWQLRVASGEPLPLSQEQLGSPKGHAFEARVYAEDTLAGFIPAPGPLHRFVTPITRGRSDIRVETGVRSGDEVSVHYDPMIAKIVVWAEDRPKSLLKLKSALFDTKIIGLKTNIDFLLKVLSNKDFQDGLVHTDFIEDHKEELLTETSPSTEVVAAAAFGRLLQFENRLKTKSSFPGDYDSFRVSSTSQAREVIHLNFQGTKYAVEFERRVPNSYVVSVNGKTLGKVSGHLDDSDSLVFNLESRSGISHRTTLGLMTTEDTTTIFTQDANLSSVTFDIPAPDFVAKESASAGSSSGDVSSPMPGVIEHILVKEGQPVKAGEALVVIMAMKMEYTLKSPIDGIVTSVQFRVGQNVPKGAILVSVK